MKVTEWDLSPLIVFVLAYIVTGYVGVMLLLYGPPAYSHLYTYFSGVEVPAFTAQERSKLLYLLHLPILALGAAYAATTVMLKSLWNTRNTSNAGIESGTVPAGLLLLSILVAMISLYRGEAFANAGAWLDHDRWIAMRWQLFDRLSFFEFVNIYVLMPALSALVIVHLGARRWVLSVAVVTIGLALSLLLFQKKQVIVYLLFVAVAYTLRRGGNARIWRNMVIGGVAIVGAYVALVIVPTLGKGDLSSIERISRGDPVSMDFAKLASESREEKRDQEVARRSPRTAVGDDSPDSESNDGFTKLADSRDKSPAADEPHLMSLFRTQVFEDTVNHYLEMESRGQQLLYTMSSVIFRCSAPAIFYPRIFPEQHPFYGLDLPFDRMAADDNRVVWNFMWPNTPGGSIASAVQFSLYAQIGVPGAIFWSGAVGAFLALLWFAMTAGWFRRSLAAVWGTTVVMFAIFLAIDSLRNALIVSYGMIWALMLVAAMELTFRLMERQRAGALHPPNSIRRTIPTSATQG
ncbi:MAG: hypothetical protein ACR2RB_03365 [Gammaproteobacteria bacterium]